MFEYKSNKTADGLSCDVEPRLYLAVPYFRVPYGCAVLPHKKSTAFPFFNSIQFILHSTDPIQGHQEHTDMEIVK